MERNKRRKKKPLSRGREKLPEDIEISSFLSLFLHLVSVTLRQITVLLTGYSLIEVLRTLAIGEIFLS